MKEYFIFAPPRITHCRLLALCPFFVCGFRFKKNPIFFSNHETYSFERNQRMQNKAKTKREKSIPSSTMFGGSHCKQLSMLLCVLNPHEGRGCVCVRHFWIPMAVNSVGKLEVPSNCLLKHWPNGGRSGSVIATLQGRGPQATRGGWFDTSPPHPIPQCSPLRAHGSRSGGGAETGVEEGGRES